MPPKKIKVETTRFTTDKVVCSEGIDTYLFPGSKVTQINLARNTRSDFFKNRPTVHALLLRDEHNPIVREEDQHNNRQGEFFLNHEAITLLVERLIRTHKAQANGLKYNSKNIFVIKNDCDNLEHILNNLALNNGDDAKIIYIDAIHSISCYIRNIEGLIHCFIIDPELSSSCSILADSIKKVFPSVIMVLSTGNLQKDYYSCSTFAIKALLYFVKHGDEVFPYIDNIYEKNSNNIHKKIKLTKPPSQELQANELMPTLLKMLQGSLNLSKETLNTIVSHKQQLTLADYYEKYALTHNGKTYNSAALIKKYNYLDKLNHYLTSIGVEEISADSNISLPFELTKRHELYAKLPIKQVTTMQTHPVTAYDAISAYLDGRIYHPTDHGILRVFDAIDNKFPRFQKEYKQTFKQSAVSALNDCDYIQRLFFVAAYAEIQDLDHLQTYYKYATKLITLCANKEAVLYYLYNNVQINNKQAIHDVCQFNLPEGKDDWNQKFWAKLAINHGHAATKYLALARHINQLLLKHKKADPKVSDLEHIYSLLQNFQYAGAEQHKELAALCIDLRLSQSEFDRCLELIKNELKTFDFLPEISFSCADIDKRFAKYTFKKLPINDLRGFFLGEYTSCCQSIHKNGSNCAIHGMTSAFGGFYVLCNDKEEIIAQTWAWISTEGQIVFDSWEYINKTQAYLCKPIILKAAQRLIDAGFTRVLIGTGGHTPDLGLPKAKDPASFLMDSHYSDARSQYVIQINSNKSRLARFQDFSKGYGLTSTKYDHLISETPNDDFIVKLGQLIATKALPFDDFIKLITFQYIHLNEFLHQRTETTYTLLVAAFAEYGNRMRPLLSLKNCKDKRAIDVFLSFDEGAVLLPYIINTIGVEHAASINKEPMQFHDLIYSAVESDAIITLNFLYQMNEHRLSYDGLAYLESMYYMSLLQFASRKNAHRCFGHILYHISHELLLNVLLDKKHTKHFLVLHYLAQANAVSYFKYIETICDNQSLIALLNQKITTRYSEPMDVNVLITALHANSWEFVTYILNGAYGFNQDTLCTPETIEQAVSSNSLNTLNFLWKLHKNEALWLKSLLSIENNVLTLAFSKRSYEIALFLLNSFMHVDNLHALLTHRPAENYISSLDYFSCQKQPELIASITNKLLSTYCNNKKQLVVLFSPGLRKRSFFYDIIYLRNTDLLKQILQYFSEDSQLLDKLLFNQGPLITVVNAVLEHSCLLGAGYNWDALDILFSACSAEQQKRMLINILFSYTTPEQVNYLLNLADTLDQGTFGKTWATFDTNSLLHKSSFNSKLFPMVFDYYQKFYTVASFNEGLVNNWPLVIKAVLNDNIGLLKQIYPAIRTDSAKVRELFELYTKSDDKNCNSFEWLLDQNEVLDSWLIESLGSDKRRQAKMSAILEANTTALLWLACSKRLPKAQLREIAAGVYWDIYIKIAPDFFGWGNPRFLYSKILSMFYSIITCAQEENPNSTALFTKTNEQGVSAFTCSIYSGKIAFIFILAHCTQEQRQELLENYKKLTSTNNQKEIAEIACYIAALQKFDVLIALKSELLLTMQSQSSLGFFQDIDPAPQQLLALLNPFSLQQIVYENDNLCHITAAQINACWSQTRAALNTLSHPAYKTLCSTYQEQMSSAVLIKPVLWQ